MQTLKMAPLFLAALALVAADKDPEPKKKIDVTKFSDGLTIALLLVDKEPEPKKKDATPPKADVRGEVKSVNALKAKDLVGNILVEGKKEKDTTHDKASVTLTSATKIYFFDGEKKEAKFTDLKQGTKVQCTFTGPVAESYPVQARASEVLILVEEKKKKD